MSSSSQVNLRRPGNYVSVSLQIPPHSFVWAFHQYFGRARKSDVSTRREFTVTLLTIWQKFPKFLRGNQVIHQLICKFQISGYFHAAVHLLLPFRMGSRNRLFFRAFPLEVFRKLKGRPSHFLREKPRRQGW